MDRGSVSFTGDTAPTVVYTSGGTSGKLSHSSGSYDPTVENRVSYGDVTHSGVSSVFHALEGLLGLLTVSLT